MTDEHCERHDTEGDDELCTCSAERTMERAQRAKARTAARPGLAKARVSLDAHISQKEHRVGKPTTNHKGNLMKRLTVLTAAALIAAVFVLSATAEGGQATAGFATSISFDEGCRPDGCRSNPDPGGSVVVGVDDDVPSGAIGLECSVQFDAKNNESIHAGVNLVISSTGEGSNAVQIPGIEDEGFQSSTAEGTLTLLGPVTVSIVFGPEGISSLGGTVHLECIETTTTTEPTTTTTPVETTTTLPPTPKAPPVPAEPTFAG